MTRRSSVSLYRYDKVKESFGAVFGDHGLVL